MEAQVIALQAEFAAKEEEVKHAQSETPRKNIR